MVATIVVVLVVLLVVLDLPKAANTSAKLRPMALTAIRRCKAGGGGSVLV